MTPLVDTTEENLPAASEARAVPPPQPRVGWAHRPCRPWPRTRRQRNGYGTRTYANALSVESAPRALVTGSEQPGPEGALLWSAGWRGSARRHHPAPPACRSAAALRRGSRAAGGCRAACVALAPNAPSLHSPCLHKRSRFLGAGVGRRPRRAAAVALRRPLRWGAAPLRGGASSSPRPCAVSAAGAAGRSVVASVSGAGGVAEGGRPRWGCAVRSPWPTWRSSSAATLTRRASRKVRVRCASPSLSFPARGAPQAGLARAAPPSLASSPASAAGREGADGGRWPQAEGLTCLLLAGLALGLLCAPACLAKQRRKARSCGSSARLVKRPRREGVRSPRQRAPRTAQPGSLSWGSARKRLVATVVHHRSRGKRLAGNKSKACFRIC